MHTTFKSKLLIDIFVLIIAQNQHRNRFFVSYLYIHRSSFYYQWNN